MSMEKAKQVSLMAECFPHSQVTDVMTATYLEACQDVPLEAVVRACKEIRHGDDQRANKSFIPSTAEFSQYVKRCDQLIRAEERVRLDMAEKRRLAIEAPNVVKLTDAERAKRVGRLKALAEEVRAACAIPKSDRPSQTRLSGRKGLDPKELESRTKIPMPGEA